MNTGSWQPDPTQRHQYRLWDGVTWTDRVSDNGVVGSDPISIPSAPHPAWTPPTTPMPAVPMTPVIASTTAPQSRNQLWAILIGVAALVAAGVFAVVYLQKDDSSATPATSVTTSEPATTTTAPTAITSSPATTTTTIAPVIDAATLIAAMPTDAEVPSEWSRNAEPQEVTSMTGEGECHGPTDVSRAFQSGSTAYVAGPRWWLPNDGWFGLSVVLFPTESDASAYLLATDAQASSCTTTPVVWEQSEEEIDYFANDFGNDAIWQLTEIATASAEPTVNGDEDLRVLQERRSSTVDEGVSYSRVYRWIYSYERHGRVVINFWIGGHWGEGGWDSYTGAYQPTDADLDAAADVMRAGILARLSG